MHDSFAGPALSLDSKDKLSLNFLEGRNDRFQIVATICNNNLLRFLMKRGNACQKPNYLVWLIFGWANNSYIFCGKEFHNIWLLMCLIATFGRNGEKYPLANSTASSISLWPDFGSL